MKYLCIVFLLVLLSWSASAKKLNYIEAHLMRLSSQQNPTHWLLPFRHVKNPKSFESNIMLSMEKGTYPLYKDIQSKDQDKIQDRLEESFGKPYDVSAKVNFGFRHQNFSQFFSTNGGAVLLVTDPVFPELKGFLFHDYSANSAYLFRPHPRLILKPQLSYGIRKVLNEEYTVGQLVDKSLDVKFNQTPYIGFLEFNLLSILSLSNYGQILFEVNSFPLLNNDYEYWDTFLGYKTPDFLKGKGWVLAELSLYGGYAPFYGGQYDVSRTYKIGARTAIGENFDLDLFTMDDFYPAAIASFNFSYASLELFTFERAYDDFGNQKSREYGFNIKALW
jgi:hypothetical protein